MDDGDVIFSERTDSRVLESPRHPRRERSGGTPTSRPFALGKPDASRLVRSAKHDDEAVTGERLAAAVGDGDGSVVRRDVHRADGGALRAAVRSIQHGDTGYCHRGDDDAGHEDRPDDATGTPIHA
ncbi:hypothetical protein GCM10009066_02900 [Halarchaeum salinum]|uniref:Uncharacterized protein n=1 Tax=Halarchaeum salinum TaxID=489912 RepID=A0AAV3S4H3_9EURY